MDDSHDVRLAQARRVDGMSAAAMAAADAGVRAEFDARAAIREHHHVTVTVRNAITRRPTAPTLGDFLADPSSFGGFRATFTDLDAARQFADEHRLAFNNCRVTIQYLAGYTAVPTFVPDNPRLWGSSGTWTTTQQPVFNTI
jgi:hypothetical protein